MDIQINYDYRPETVEHLGLEDLAKLVLTHEHKPDNTEVSINFVTDEEIAALNESYRGIVGPTDVLSFECDGFDDDFDEGFAQIEDEEQGFALGDIFIAPDVAQRQTAQFGTTFADEIYLLTTHGLLHLCGYDHLVDEEAEVMEALEQVILDQWAQQRA